MFLEMTEGAFTALTKRINGLLPSTSEDIEVGFICAFYVIVETY